MIRNFNRIKTSFPSLSLVSSFTTRTRAPIKKGQHAPRFTVPNTILQPEYAITGKPLNTSNVLCHHTPEEIVKARKAARLARKMLEFSLSLVKPGITTEEIDRLTHEEMIKHNCYPSPLNYAGFPKSICTSVNEVICHGIPDNQVLQLGDLISIDVSLYHDGFHGDNCASVIVGGEEHGDEIARKLLRVSKNAVDEAIKICKPGV